MLSGDLNNKPLFARSHGFLLRLRVCQRYKRLIENGHQIDQLIPAHALRYPKRQPRPSDEVPVGNFRAGSASVATEVFVSPSWRLAECVPKLELGNVCLGSSCFLFDSLWWDWKDCPPILDRDLSAAGIKKSDERGRTNDVHALRTPFGTLLSKGGVAPRTAQAAMRHSTIDLTMNVYTDPKLLDVHGALNSLPPLDLNPSPSTERNAMRATGTDDQGSKSYAISSDVPSSQFAPAFTPNSGKRGQTVSFAVISSADGDERVTRRATQENPNDSSEKALPAVFANKAFSVERRRIELPTSALRTQRSPS